MEKKPYAGEIYLSSAKKILYIQKNAAHMIQDITDFKKGDITIGIGLERGSLVLPYVYPKFCEKYPGINVKFVQNNQHNLIDLTLQGHVDISLLSLFQEDIELDYDVICKEEIILAVPKSHRLAYLVQNSLKGELPVIDLLLFKDDPFVLTKQGNKSRQISDLIFKDAAITPNVMFECDNAYTTFNIASNSAALTLVPDTILGYTGISKNSVYFSINREKYSKELIAAYRKDTYLNRSSLDFISMLKPFFNSLVSSIKC